ncbi:MAG: DeoR/GlpR transcriptional regulator [Firmicutes bacterium]|nr:DeoR/GlpR transcriptional regulator [Bacillota bacterium]
MMLPEQRRQEILRYVNEKRKANVNELAEVFQASPNTIRRDLSILSQRGQVTRTHGGIIANNFYYEMSDFSYMERASQYLTEKRKIGRAAAQLIGEGETVIIDFGTTALEVARHLSHLKNCTILTSSLSVATELVTYSPQVTVHLSGGTVNSKINGLIGPVAESFYSQVHADKLFLSVAGMEISRGLVSSNWFEVNIKRAMIQQCNECILLLPNYRLGNKGLVVFSDITPVNKVITDMPLPAEYQAFFDRRQIEVIIADDEGTK